MIGVPVNWRGSYTRASTSEVTKTGMKADFASPLACDLNLGTRLENAARDGLIGFADTFSSMIIRNV